MGIGSALIGFFSALPDLVKLLQELMTFITKASGGDPAAYIAKLGQAMSLVNSAQTQEDRANAAKAVADAIANLPAK